MTTVAASRPAPASAWFPLAARELRRYVTNPVFLAGVVLAAYGIWTAHRTVAIDVDTFVTFPATYLGGFGLIAAFWLTRSMHRSSAVVDIAPTEMPARTAAICAVALVPFLLSLIDLVVIARFQPVAGSFT